MHSLRIDKYFLAASCGELGLDPRRLKEKSMSDSTKVATEIPDVSPTVVAAAMMAQDAASQWLGMRLEAADMGYAQIAMDIGEHMVNGHGNCHGGLIFALGDTAFATACNTCNQVTVGNSCRIDYLRPVKAGDTLTATAVEGALAGRSGLYDVTLRNQDRAIVAVFHGRSQRLRGAVVDCETG
jgi:acyl-CoA thioesterase